MSSIYGELAALGTALCWSFSAVIFTLAGRRLGALYVNLIRLPLAVVALGVTFFLSGGNMSGDWYSVGMLAISGIIGLAVGDTFLFSAMILIGSRLSMLLLSLSPPITAFLAFVFLKEKLSGIAVAGILITVCGVSWVVSERRPRADNLRTRFNLKGILFGIMAALGQSLGLIFAKQGLSHGTDPLFGTLIRMMSATAIIWPVHFFLRGIKSPFAALKADVSALKLVLAGMVMGPYLGVWLSLIAIKHALTGVAATIMSIVPVTMLPLVVIWEKERLSVRAVAGAIVTVVGISILFLRG